MERTDELIELWLTPETRIIESQTGSLRPVEFTVLIWAKYDDLIHAGYSHSWLLDIALDPDGWSPENAPFELRLSATIAYAHEMHLKRVGSFE